MILIKNKFNQTPHDRCYFYAQKMKGEIKNGY